MMLLGKIRAAGILNLISLEASTKFKITPLRPEIFIEGVNLGADNQAVTSGKRSVKLKFCAEIPSHSRFMRLKALQNRVV